MEASVPNGDAHSIDYAEANCYAFMSKYRSHATVSHMVEEIMDSQLEKEKKFCQTHKELKGEFTPHIRRTKSYIH